MSNLLQAQYVKFLDMTFQELSKPFIFEIIFITSYKGRPHEYIVAKNFDIIRAF